MANQVTCYAWSFEGAPVVGTAVNDLSWVAIPGRSRMASTDAVAALLRARAPQLTILRCFGEILADGRFACSEAVVLFEGDVTDSLDILARYCGYAVQGIWDPDAIVRRYLATGDAALRHTAHHNAWLASAELHGAERAAARIAMYAASPDARVLAAREAYRLTGQIISELSLDNAMYLRVRLERSFASQFQKGIGSNLMRSLTTSLRVSQATDDLRC